MTTNDRFYSISEVPDHYPWSVGSVYNLVRSGEIKGVKIGRKSLVARSELESYIARKAQPLVLKGSKAG